MVFAAYLRKWFKRILLFLVTLILFLACVEIFLQLFDPFHFKEVEAMSSFSKTVLWSDGGEVKLRPNVRSSYLGKKMTINSHGMRGPETSVEKPGGVYRILVIGDSVPFGWGVGDEEPFPRLIERMLNDQSRNNTGDTFEIINSAVPSWGLKEEYNFLIESGFDYQPDMILLMVIYNDLPYHLNPRVSKAFIPGSLFNFRVTRLISYITRIFITGRPPSDYDPRERLKPEGIDPICAALNRFNHACMRAGAPLVLLDGICHEKIRQCCDRIGIDYIELDISWDHLKNYLVSPTDNHPNAECHRLMANKIYQALVDRILK